MAKAILQCTFVHLAKAAALDSDGILQPPEFDELLPGTLVEISQRRLDEQLDTFGVRLPTKEEANGTAIAVDW